MKSVKITLIIILLSACGERGNREATRSSYTDDQTLARLIHPRWVPLFDCTLAPDFKAAYDQSVKERLAQLFVWNSNILNGHYAPNNLCFIESPDIEGVNASASSENGTIRISPALDQMDHLHFVAIMAHELGHILGRHQLAGFDFPLPWLREHSTYTSVSQHYLKLSARDLSTVAERWQRLDMQVYSPPQRFQIRSEIAKIKKLSFEQRALLGDMNEEFTSSTGLLPEDDADVYSSLHYQDREKVILGDGVTLANELQELVEKMIDLPDALLGKNMANMWKEIDADLLGVKLFMQAGYRKSDYMDMLWHFLGAAKETCEDVLARKEEPAMRGPFSRSHPTTCWRIFNIKQNWDASQIQLAKIH